MAMNVCFQLPSGPLKTSSQPTKRAVKNMGQNHLTKLYSKWRSVWKTLLSVMYCILENNVCGSCYIMWSDQTKENCQFLQMYLSTRKVIWKQLLEGLTLFFSWKLWTDSVTERRKKISYITVSALIQISLCCCFLCFLTPNVLFHTSCVGVRWKMCMARTYRTCFDIFWKKWQFAFHPLFAITYAFHICIFER